MSYTGEKTKLKLQDIVRSANVAEKLSEEELTWYGTQAVDGYNADLNTRSEWAERNERAIKLALQVVETKTFPWTGASNVKFPLVTIAALQFLARISVLTGGRQLAKVEPWGADPDGKKAARAERISTFTSYQLLEQDHRWVDNDETAKLSAAILGCAIKHTFYDGVEGVNRSQYAPLMDFVVDYHCKDIDMAQRATLRMDVFENKIEENVRRGLFLEMYDDAPPGLNIGRGMNLLKAASDEAAGLAEQAANGLRPYSILQQHCWLDLDDDGYSEPYIMFVREDTKQVLRIVARFFDVGDVFRAHDKVIKEQEGKAKETQDPAQASIHEKTAERLDKHPDNKIIRIVPTTYFTKYTFIPSPDGGFYGLGLGALLGPTNAAVDTLINQIIDAGTMLTTSGGFLGRGVKIKSGKQSFDPFEWKPVDGAGDDLRKNIVPLPVNPPNEVLFQLLGMLVQYGEKIGSATDMMTGVSPGQNTPAETSRNTLEQGMMLFSGIYKRMYRAFGEELKKMYNLNRLYLKQSPHFAELTGGEAALIAPDDFDSNAYRIYPSADPTAVSPAQKQQKAQTVFQIFTARPQGFNPYLVVKRLLEAHDVDDIDGLYPDPQGPKAIKPPPNPKIMIEQAKIEQKGKETQLKGKIHEDEMQLAIAELQLEAKTAAAKVIELQAKAMKEAAEAKGVEVGHTIALIEAQIGAENAHKERALKLIDTLARAHQASRQNDLTEVKLEQEDAREKAKPQSVG